MPNLAVKASYFTAGARLRIYTVPRKMKNRCLRPGSTEKPSNSCRLDAAGEPGSLLI